MSVVKISGKIIAEIQNYLTLDITITNLDNS